MAWVWTKKLNRFLGFGGKWWIQELCHVLRIWQIDIPAEHLTKSRLLPTASRIKTNLTLYSSLILNVAPESKLGSIEMPLGSLAMTQWWSWGKIIGAGVHFSAAVICGCCSVSWEPLSLEQKTRAGGKMRGRGRHNKANYHSLSTSTYLLSKIISSCLFFSGYLFICERLKRKPVWW